MPVHPDRLTGLFAGIIHRMGRKVPYSLDRLEHYWGKSMDEIFPAPTDIPVLKRRRRWKLGGVFSEDIQFPSTYAPLDEVFEEQYEHQYQKCHTVYAKRIIPPGSEGRPRMLYIHGYMQPETPLEELVLVTGLARAMQMEVIQLQPPHHGRRKARGSRFDGEYYWSSDIVRSVEAVRQTIWDARHLLNALFAEDDRPFGVTGISLGGSISAILTCVEPRLTYSFPLIAHMDLAAVTRDAPVLGRMRRELDEYGWQLNRFTELLGSWGWYDLKPLVPREHIHLFAGRADHFFPANKVEAMWEEWGQPAIKWRSASHMGFIPFLPIVFRQMRTFLDDRCL